MLEHIINNTLKYIEKQSKTERKKLDNFLLQKKQQNIWLVCLILLISVINLP